MARAIIQTVNTGAQDVVEGGIIELGTTTHRYGCDLKQNGNGIMAIGDGYYEIKANVIITPAATGDVTVSILNNGTAIPGALATGAISTVGDSLTLPINFIVRRGCYCANADTFSIELTTNAGTVTNIVVDVEKK